MLKKIECFLFDFLLKIASGKEKSEKVSKDLGKFHKF